MEHLLGSLLADGARPPRRLTLALALALALALPLPLTLTLTLTLTLRLCQIDPRIALVLMFAERKRAKDSSR